MPRGRSLAAALLGVALLGCAALACGGGKEVILRTATGKEVTAEDLDRAPLFLLPPNGVGWAHVDLVKTAATPLGQRLISELEARLPLPESAGLSFRRDLSAMSVATYSMQGIDFAGVATGRFDAERIAAAARQPPADGLGPPITESVYAGRRVFMAQNVGFVVLTPRTALFGNEAGIRRSLDRIVEGRVADDLPPWVRDLLATPNATFSLGVDLTSSPITASLPARLGALHGASIARGVGNFDAPGLNLAATITHADNAGASGSANGLLQAGAGLNVYTRLFGFGQLIRKLETQALGNDTEVVLALDGPAIEGLMQRFLPPAPKGPLHSAAGWANRAP